MNEKIELTNGNKVNNQEIKKLCLNLMRAQDSKEAVDFLKKNDHVIISDALYNPTRNFCEKILKNY